MQCPHCQEELNSTECPTCGHKAIEGAKFCHECGHLLPGVEEPKLLTCSTCGQKALPEAKFCAHCGEEVGEGHSHEGEAPANGERVACGDGDCIGIIGEDGKCTDCGKSLSETQD